MDYDRISRIAFWFIGSAVLIMLFIQAYESFGYPNAKGTLDVSTEGFNLHDEYANPMDVCSDKFSMSPIAVSEPWNHTTIVLCARWMKGEMYIVTQSGRSHAEVDSTEMFMWPGGIMMYAQEVFELHEATCRDGVFLGVKKGSQFSPVDADMSARDLAVSGIAMCFDPSSKEIYHMSPDGFRRVHFRNVTVF